MTEQALTDPSNDNGENRVAGEVVNLDPAQTEIFTEVIRDESGDVVSRREYEIWPLLDIRLSDKSIDELASEWIPSRVFQGSGNLDRPTVAIRWMMLKTHATVDASVESRNMKLYHELLEFVESGRKTKPARLKNLPIPTHFDIVKVGHADSGDELIREAAHQLESKAANGLSDLIDYLMDVEDRVSPRVGNVNLVRLFNAIDAKNGGKDNDMIIAKRLLLIMLDQALSNPA